MRSRLVREGSVGLFIVVGLAVVGGTVVWLRGLNVGARKYRVIVDFDNANQLIVGSPAFYRGVRVGEIVEIDPRADGVDVTLTVSPPDLRIPSNSIIEANQSGLIGETSIDIIPQEALPPESEELLPLAETCDSSAIVCDGDRVDGQVGASIDRLIRSTADAAEAFSDPELIDNINQVALSANDAASEIATVSRELSDIADLAEVELAELSSAANATASQVTLTAAELAELVDRVDGLVGENRDNITATLASIRRASESVSATVDELNATVAVVAPNVRRLNEGLAEVDLEQFALDLESITADASVAIANLRETSDALASPENVALLEETIASARATFANAEQITAAIGDPANITQLQQTLDSARATFANAEKITADLDELTGSPEFRSNVRELIDGLSDLVSSTEELERQLATARALAPAEALVYDLEALEVELEKAADDSGANARP